MDRVADDLVDHAAMVGDDAGRCLEVSIQQRNQIGRLGALRHAGEALDVGEQDGDLAQLSAQSHGAGVGHDAAHHFGREMLLETEPQHARMPLVQRETGESGHDEADKRQRGRADRIDQQAIAGRGGDGGTAPGEADQQDQTGGKRWSRPHRQQQTDGCQHHGGDQFRGAGPVPGG